MDETVRSLVRERAGNRCEYCRLPQRAVDGRFQVEHIIARQHTIDDSLGNLALACDRCNLFKGPNLSSIDPDTGEIVRLFHTRQDQWSVHFEIRGDRIIGLTSSGRATVQLLQFNAKRRVELRSALSAAGDLPDEGDTR